MHATGRGKGHMKDFVRLGNEKKRRRGDSRDTSNKGSTGASLVLEKETSIAHDLAFIY